MDRHRFPDWVIETLDKILEDTGDSQYGEALVRLRSQAGYEAVLSMVAGGSNLSSYYTYPNVKFTNNSDSILLAPQGSSTRYYGVYSNNRVLTNKFRISVTFNNSNPSLSQKCGLLISNHTVSNLTNTNYNFPGIALTLFQGQVNITLFYNSGFPVIYTLEPSHNTSLVYELRCDDINGNVFTAYVNGVLKATYTTEVMPVKIQNELLDNVNQTSLGSIGMTSVANMP